MPTQDFDHAIARDLPQTVPFTPEKAARLKSRFAAAVDRVVTRDDTYVVTAHRCHLFDYEDGLRIVVSHEDHGATSRFGECVHFSLVMHDRSVIERRLIDVSGVRDGTESSLKAGAALATLMKEGVARFRRLSGYEGRVQAVCVTPRGVPHFTVPYADWIESRCLNPD